MQSTRWNLVYAVTALVFALVLVGLVMAVPVKDGARDWFAPLVRNGWMAWTFPVALFFTVIAGLLAVFTILAIRFPETPKRGVLGIETTRGDRLFISLLGSAFICLGWLFFFGAPLTWALILCLAWAVAVFRFV